MTSRWFLLIENPEPTHSDTCIRYPAMYAHCSRCARCMRSTLSLCVDCRAELGALVDVRMADEYGIVSRLNNPTDQPGRCDCGVPFAQHSYCGQGVPAPPREWKTSEGDPYDRCAALVGPGHVTTTLLGGRCSHCHGWYERALFLWGSRQSTAVG